MKKIIIALVALLSLAAAPEAYSQFRWGPTAGIDITTLKFKQDLFQVDQSVGYTVGVASELMFPGIGFGIDMGLLYTQRGATLHLGEREIWASQGYGNERSYLHYLEIPLHVRFKYTNLNGVENYIAPFVYAGPSIGIIVGHGNIDALKYAGGDFGLTVGLGAELKRNWQVSAEYTWGMSYAVQTKLLDKFSAKNRDWVVRVAYLF